MKIPNWLTPKWLLKGMADTQFHYTPFFITYKPAQHKVKGPEVRKVLETIQRADFLLSKHDGYLSNSAVPGFWAHSMIYVGDNTVIHAIGSGVVEDDVLTVCRCDHICVLRLISFVDLQGEELFKAEQEIIDYAKWCVSTKVQYDFVFEDKNGKVYCTELLDESTGGVFEDDYKIVGGRHILSPQGIRDSNKVMLKLEIKH